MIPACDETCIVAVARRDLLLVIADKLGRCLMKTSVRYGMRFAYLAWRK